MATPSVNYNMCVYMPLVYMRGVLAPSVHVCVPELS